MRGKVVFHHISVEPFFAPIGKRIDLQAAIFNLETGQRAARRRLECLATGELRVETRQSLLQRQDLADFAAAIGVIRPAQAIAVLLLQQICVRLQIAQILKPQLLAQLFLIGNRFGKMLARVEE